MLRKAHGASNAGVWRARCASEQLVLFEVSALSYAPEASQA